VAFARRGVAAVFVGSSSVELVVSGNPRRMQTPDAPPHIAGTQCWQGLVA
jgi:hypothetical protein